MRLSRLAAGVPGSRVLAGPGHEVRRVVADSRSACPGDLFVALKGARADGHDHIAEAAAAGAAVAGERLPELPPAVPRLLLADSRDALGQLAAELAGRPARRLLVAGVTGTDGKTTVTHMAAHILRHCGLPAGLVSTVSQTSAGGERANDSGLSTLAAPDVQARLAEMAGSGIQAAVIEATSHALVQGRVAGCDFDAVAVTNIGRDHLDYHVSAPDYLAAKASIIDLCAAAPDKGLGTVKTAVLNRDDPSYEALAGRPIPRRIACSLEPDRPASVRARDLAVEAGRSTFTLQVGDAEAPVRLPMAGRFNVANALIAAGLATAFGLGPAPIAAALSAFPGVRGRLEPVDLGQPFRVYIDFAHSAGGLEAVLAELRPLTAGRLLAVFGATARADHDRPGMGRAAARRADWFVITTDDPLGEDPAEIARAVEQGAVEAGGRAAHELEPDRRLAIRRALELARPGDTVLLAGKGHERKMMLAAGWEPWDERAEAEAALRRLGYGA